MTGIGTIGGLLAGILGIFIGSPLGIGSAGAVPLGAGNGGNCGADAGGIGTLAAGVSGGGADLFASDFGHWPAIAARPPSDTPSTPAIIFQRDNDMV
jgi:hypothetical protein